MTSRAQGRPTDTALLFPTDHDELGALDPHEPAPNSPPGPFAGVALEQSIDRVLDYSIPPRLINTLRPGQRVKVPLGKNNRPAWGYVIQIHPTTNYPKIKPLLAVEDQRVLVNDQLMRLALWISRYYITPLGAVIETMIPSAVKKRIGLGYIWLAGLAADREKAQEAFEKIRGRKRKALLARLLQLDPGQTIELQRLAGEAGTTIPTIRKFAREGLIALTQEPDLPSLSIPDPIKDAAPAESEITLNADQQRALADIQPRLTAGFSVNLLLGVTGSGKTELYLRCIRQIVDAGKQAIVMVPEIALTPQTVRRFTARFDRVAVLHSGLSASQRHRFWQQVAMGHAQVVVGARSAVFAPLPNLGIIVVDEEHDASYKQDQAPRYNARDVAVKRAQLESIPIILGSATPSLETWHRFDNLPAPSTDESAPSAAPPAAPKPDQVHHLLRLPNRVRHLDLAKVELINMRTEVRNHRPGVHLLSRRLEQLLHHTLDSKHQAILMLNRRGYSNFVYCPSCGHVIHCRFCDKTMTYHRSAGANPHSASSALGLHTGQLHCHYCLAVSPLPAQCPECGKKLSLFGLGTQRVEEELAKKFPTARFARVDSDSMRNSRDYEKTLARFAAREIDILLGTQMIAKGLDYPNVTLVGVISGDTALALPDFRAAERTFQLITQVAGRAGRGDSPGRVVVQTFLPDDPAIRFAAQQDFPGFARRELTSRQEVGLPPYTRMARLILRDQDVLALNELSDTLKGELTALTTTFSLNQNSLRIEGPMPCAVARIAGYYRAQIVLYAPDPRPIQQVLAALREKGSLAKSDRIAVDVDPVSLL